MLIVELRAYFVLKIVHKNVLAQNVNLEKPHLTLSFLISKDCLCSIRKNDGLRPGEK